MARSSPVGGAQDASHGGTGIGPEDALSALSQTSQERVPAKATVVPTRAAIAAQVKGSRRSDEQNGRTVVPKVIESSTLSVYVSGGSDVPLLRYSPGCVEGEFWEDEMRRPTPYTQYP